MTQLYWNHSDQTFRLFRTPECEESDVFKIPEFSMNISDLHRK